MAKGVCKKRIQYSASCQLLESPTLCRRKFRYTSLLFGCDLRLSRFSSPIKRRKRKQSASTLERVYCPCLFLDWTDTTEQAQNPTPLSFVHGIVVQQNNTTTTNVKQSNNAAAEPYGVYIWYVLLLPHKLKRNNAMVVGFLSLVCVVRTMRLRARRETFLSWHEQRLPAYLNVCLYKYPRGSWNLGWLFY
jgi:hypothetical protein